MTRFAGAIAGLILAFFLVACTGPAESGAAVSGTTAKATMTTFSSTASSSASVTAPVTASSTSLLPADTSTIPSGSRPSAATISEALALIRQALGLTPAEVEALLGKDYQAVETGVDGKNMGYRYQKLGFTIGFDKRNADGQERAYQASIDTPAFDVFGTRLGMPFSEVISIRGQTAIRSSFVKDDNSPSHYITYSRDGLNTVYDSGSPPAQPPVAQSITITRIAS